MKSKADLLREHHLRSTDSRTAILSLFVERQHALSYSDIEQSVAQTFDRVTVYRTLKTFLDKGMIHKVLDDGGALKYALCHYCQGENHQHDHVHFKCAVCGETSCLDDVYVPRVNLPEGYQVAEVNLLVQGVCARCR